MATVVSKTIGFGFDYEKLNIALAANFGASGADFTAVDEVVTNTISAPGNFLTGYLNQDGLTTDATRFLTIDCLAAHKHAGIYPSDMDFSGIAYGLVETDAAVLLQDPYTVLRDLMIVQRPTAGYVTGLYVAAPNCLVENCVIVGDSRGRACTEQYAVQWNFSSGVTTLRNCVIICYDDDLVSHRWGLFQGPVTGGVLVLENCTIWSGDRGAYIRANGGLVLKNCVLRGNPSSGAPGGGYDINNVAYLGGTSTNNAYRDAGAHVDLTGVADSAIFVDAADFNFQTRSGSALRGAGTDLATCPEDIVGTSRPAGGYDIGAFQNPAAATYPISPVYNSSIALALRLITKWGETATIYRRSDTIPDADKPWERTSAETGYVTPAVWLNAEIGLPPGSVVEAGDQIVYVPASGLSIVPEAATDQIEREDGSRWSIVAVRTLKPGQSLVMHELVVRQ